MAMDVSQRLAATRHHEPGSDYMPTAGEISEVRARLARLELAVGLNATPSPQRLILPNIYQAKIKPRQSPRIQAYSVYRLFQIPELLEVILLYLPPLQLLRMNQVSKTFKSTINGSLNIQRALFMAPPVEQDTPFPKGLIKVNHLLKRLPRDHPYSFRGQQFEIVEGPKLTYGRTFRRPRERWEHEFPVRIQLSQHTVFPFDKAFPKDGSEMVEPSWRRMYLTQPPCEIRLYKKRAGNRSSHAPMTFGALLRTLVEEWEAGLSRNFEEQRWLRAYPRLE